MAVNRRFKDSMITRNLPVPATWVSGRPVAKGNLVGVCLEDRDTAGFAVVQLDGSFNIPVEAKDSSGVSGADANSAVAIGDDLYYDETPTTPGFYLSKRAGGVFFGRAEATITSGSTGTISVKVGK